MIALMQPISRNNKRMVIERASKAHKQMEKKETIYQSNECSINYSIIH